MRGTKKKKKDMPEFVFFFFLPFFLEDNQIIKEC